MSALTKKTDIPRNRWLRRLRWRKLIAYWRPALKCAVAAGLLVEASGCIRSFYRKRADEEVSEIVAQKDKYPEWAVENWHVYPDPQARFADPTDPDHPPKPPDDPAAYALSPNPQKPGKAGVERIEGTGYLHLLAKWDQENRDRKAQQAAEEKAKYQEPPSTEEQDAGAFEKNELKAQPGVKPPPPDSLPKPDVVSDPFARRDALEEVKARSLIDVTDRPTYMITLDQAAELAMFNSRQYQDQRENLYLAALPVSLERFSFMSQFFAAQESIRNYAGSEANGGKANNWALNNGIGLSKVLPTGGLLLLSFSNQTVFDFLNPKNVTSVSNLNFNAIQPLLRGGGEAVALESLTQSERNLLYQIRTYARFRKELYVAIASNSGGSISGASFQPTGVLSAGGGGGGGLSGSGLTPGAILPVPTTLTGPIISPASPGSLSLTPSLAPPPAGYLNTMLQKIQVYIDQENIDVLSIILLRYRGLLEGDVVAPLQVQNVEQQLLTGRTTLLSDQTQYLQSLDSFKLDLGVPTNLNIETDDSVLQPLLKQFRRARAVTENESTAVSEASALIPLANAPRLRRELLRLFTTSTIVRGTPFVKTIRGRWAEWEKLSDNDLKKRIDDLRVEAKKILDHQAELQTQNKTLSAEEQVRLREVNSQLDLGSFERALRLYEHNYVEMGKPKKIDMAEERKRLTEFSGVVYSWQKVLVEARNDQWNAVRASWPDLPRCCVDGVDLIRDDLERASEAGTRHALENRLDLMNVRGQVVDSWRQVAVFANALLGVFNVRYQLSANSPLGAAQPLNIGGSKTSHELILDTELPLTRIQERNNYRASLISYQRERRTLQQAEDLTVQAVNSELYLLRQYSESYRLQQRQLELAYLTIDSSLESLGAPTVPGNKGNDGPAALTQQLLSAQRSLPQAQNALLTIWINYLDTRLQLYRDLELMPLDARGVWIDEIRDCDCGVVAPSK